MGVLASVVRITRGRARSTLDEDGSVLKARCTDEHQALQHAERKVHTYRKAVLGLAGLLLLSLCGNLASAALTILVFKESRRSADATSQRSVVLSETRAAYDWPEARSGWAPPSDAAVSKLLSKCASFADQLPSELSQAAVHGTHEQAIGSAQLRCEFTGLDAGDTPHPATGCKPRSAPTTLTLTPAPHPSPSY